VPQRARTRNRLTPIAGFTLLELLVVVSVLALLVMVVPPFLLGATDRAEQKGAARELAAALRYARSQAIARNRPIALQLNVDAKHYRITDQKREFTLPPELEFKVYGAASEFPNETTGGIRFFPDGSSTGGQISVTLDDTAFAVDVDWLLGRVTILD